MKFLLPYHILMMILFCLLGVRSQNFENSPPGQRLKRQSEKIAKGVAIRQQLEVESRKASTSQSIVASSVSTVYALPGGSKTIIGVIKTTFSCNNRIYGYYADTDNNCKVFHVCVPQQNLENGPDKMIQYSFFCGNQTIFDQAELACTYLHDALPCSEATSLYDEVNRKFGITDPSIR